MRPKVQGAWNLHNALWEADVDFFVILASAAGIFGTRGQAIYAGTSTFLGAFARWRQAQSLPANTLYLGAVAEVDYAAEHSDKQGAIGTTYDDKGLTEREFLAFSSAAIDNQHSTPEITAIPLPTFTGHPTLSLHICAALSLLIKTVGPKRWRTPLMIRPLGPWRSYCTAPIRCN